MTLVVALAAGALAALLGSHLGLAGAAGTKQAAGITQTTGTTQAAGTTQTTGTTQAAGSTQTTATAHVAPPADPWRQSTTPAAAPLAPSRHVFIIVLGQASEAVTFPQSGAAPAPYLANTMTAEGALLPNFYAIGHNETSDYIALISGQAPNADTQGDCSTYAPFTTPITSGADYQQNGDGCIYPAYVQNIATQLDAAGYSWRDYNQSMGNTPTREPSECGHPTVGASDGTQTATAGDAYAAKHNPFVDFDSIIDDTTLCDTHVVSLGALTVDLSSAATTPNYVFITPDLCSDGSDAICPAAQRAGGYAGINAFLAHYVPLILHSPAYKQGNGLLLVTFDHALSSDASSCCGEIPGPGAAYPGVYGAGGGRVGAVAISPCIAAGTVDYTDYDDYSLLGSIENIFGLAQLGYAKLAGQSYFGAGLYTRTCNTPPKLSVKTPTISAATATATPVIHLRFGSNQAGGAFALEVRRTSGTKATAWKSLLNDQTATETAVIYNGASGQTYQFRLAAINGA